ncbi:Germinal-center associated nuclear protein, partial [Varanus komodoensis]
MSSFHIDQDTVLLAIFPSLATSIKSMLHLLDVCKALAFCKAWTEPLQCSSRLLMRYEGQNTGEPILTQRLSKWVFSTTSLAYEMAPSHAQAVAVSKAPEEVGRSPPFYWGPQGPPSMTLIYGSFLSGLVLVLHNKAHMRECTDDHLENDRILADWVKAKFIIDKNSKESTSLATSGIQTLALHTSLHMQGNHHVCVNICVKVTHGTLSTTELNDTETHKELLGTSGLILLLSPRVSTEDEVEEDIYWISALLQLKQLLQAKPFQPVVPLVVLVPSHGEEGMEKEVAKGLMLPDLISANLISDYKIVEMPDSLSDLQGTSKLSEAVQWLVANCPSSVKLGFQTFMQFIEDGLDREFNQQFYKDKKERHMAGLPSQDPSAIIELYNSVVQFLAEVASSEDLCELSWPVTEFVEDGGSKHLPHLKWNAPNHLAWLKKALLSFQIPQMDLPPLGAPWSPVCAMIFQYLSQTASSLQTQEILQSQIENLLSQTYLKWKGRNCVSFREDGPSVKEIPWDSILEVCINHKLRDWKPPQLSVSP